MNKTLAVAKIPPPQGIKKVILVLLNKTLVYIFILGLG